MKTPKSERRLELVERWYWTCKIAKHRHQTQDVAERCIVSFDTKKPSSKKYDWTPALLRATKAKHDAGMTYTEIGKAMGLSCNRIGQMMRKWERMLRSGRY